MTAQPWVVPGGVETFEAHALGADVRVLGVDRLAASVAWEAGQPAAAGRR